MVHLSRGLRLMFALMLATAAFAWFGVSGAEAASVNCGQLITDNAGILHDTSGIKASAKTLQSDGAVVHVLTFNSLPSGTLDQSVKGVVDGCKTWQGVNGGTKSNLLVFAMSMKPHTVGIFYGDRWDNAFSGENSETNIWQNYMVPDFQDGNFSQGFVDGMNQSHAVLNDYLHPSKSNNAPTTVVHEGPSSAPKVVGIIFGCLVFLVLLGVGLWLYLRRRAQGEARRTMRQRALSARDAAVELNHDLGDATQQAVRQAKVKKYSAVSAEMTANLTNALQTVETNYQNSVNAISAAAAAGEGADDPKLTTGEYEQLAQRYEKALEYSQAAKAADEQIEQIASDLQQQQAQAAQSITECETALQALNGKVTALTQEGIKTDTIQAHCSEATASLNLAREHQTDLSVLTYLGQAKASLGAADTAEKTLVRQRKELEAGLPALQKRIEQVTGQLDPAKQCFDRISSTYAPSSWEAVHGNGSAATANIEQAKQALSVATQASSTEHQEWQQGTEAMTAGNGLLDQAESYLRSIVELEKNLAHAQQTAPQEIADAEADIAKAADYEQQYDGDIDDKLKKDIRKAMATLEAAKRELEQDKPDYLQVVKLALDANHHADDIFKEASSEHEAAERLRRQAASQLTQAKSAVSQAKEYISDHRSHVHSDAEDLLRRAKTELRTAQSAPDAATVLSAARQAKDDADQAYDKAKRDVRRYHDSQSSSYGGGGYGTGLGTGIAIGSSFGSSSSSFGSSFGGSSGGFGGGGFGGSSGGFSGGGGFGGSSGGW